MQFVERLIVRSTIRHLLKAGFQLSVYDGEETTLRRSTDARAINKALGTTDDDHLMVHKAGGESPIGWVRFIYGNEPEYVINDYTTNLEEALKPVNKLIERLEARGW